MSSSFFRIEISETGLSANITVLGKKGPSFYSKEGGMIVVMVGSLVGLFDQAQASVLILELEDCSLPDRDDMASLSAKEEAWRNTSAVVSGLEEPTLH